MEKVKLSPKSVFKIKHKQILRRYLNDLKKMLMSTTFEKSAVKTISLPLERRKREHRLQAKQFLDAFSEVHEKYSKEYLNLLKKTEEIKTIEKKNISQQNLESFHKEAFSLIKVLRGKADYYLG